MGDGIVGPPQGGTHEQLPLVLSLLLGILAQASAVELLTNGNFETPVTSNATSAGWTSTNIDPFGGWFSPGGNPGGYFDVNYSGGAANQPHPTISQTVTGITVGAIYVLSGDFAKGILSTAGNADLGVSIAGVEFDYEVPQSTTAFSHFAITFAAPTTSLTATLIGERNGKDSDPRIDNIPLVQTVPEPSALAALGLGALALLRRRKR